MRESRDILSHGNGNGNESRQRSRLSCLMNRKQLLASAPVFPFSLCPLALRSALGDLNRRRMSSRVRARCQKVDERILRVRRGGFEICLSPPSSFLPMSHPPLIHHPSLSNLPRRRERASPRLSGSYSSSSRDGGTGCAGRRRRKKARRLMAI